MLCAMNFGWNWPSGSWEEDVHVYVKSLNTVRQTKKWSEKLSSGELKTIVSLWYHFLLTDTELIHKNAKHEVWGQNIVEKRESPKMHFLYLICKINIYPWLLVKRQIKLVFGFTFNTCTFINKNPKERDRKSYTIIGNTCTSPHCFEPEYKLWTLTIASISNRLKYMYMHKYDWHSDKTDLYWLTVLRSC